MDEWKPRKLPKGAFPVTGVQWLGYTYTKKKKCVVYPKFNFNDQVGAKISAVQKVKNHCKNRNYFCTNLIDVLYFYFLALAILIRFALFKVFEFSDFSFIYYFYGHLHFIMKIFMESFPWLERLHFSHTALAVDSNTIFFKDKWVLLVRSHLPILLM